MAVRRTNIPSQPSTDPLNALLDLSEALTRSKTGGVFSEALACVLSGTGLRAGVVHEASATGLDLVAEEGLPAAMREQVGSISSAAQPWFVAQTAVKRRRLIVEEDGVSMFGARVPAAVLRSSGWNALACAPLVIGRDVLGTLTVTAPSPEFLTPARLTMLETVANVVALFLAREKALSDDALHAEGQPSLTEVDEKLTRLATLGALAVGFADDLRTVSTQLTSFIKNQEKWLAQLRHRHPGAAPVIRELEPMQEEAASALMLARMSGGRLLAALDETAAEPIDVASVVQEVVGHVEPIARSRNVDVLVAVQPGSDPLVKGRRSEIRQVALGLVSDGIDACGYEDKHEFPAVPAAQMQIVSVTVTREKTKIVLVCEHSGKSASTEHRNTTTLRSPRSRDRLGLLLARNIVAGHGGTIEVTRSELGGTLVRVVFPAATPPPSSRRAKGGPASSKRSRPTIAEFEAQPTTKRDGWTAKPNHLFGGQPLAIRAPSPAKLASDESPLSEVDMLASTERGATLAASMNPSGRPRTQVVISDSTSPASTSVPPSSSRKRGQSGPPSKRRG